MNESHSPASPFCTTRWTLVREAQGDTPEAKAALGQLCDTYWTPVYRFLRHEGRGEDESRELAQEFFERLLSAGGGVERAAPERGRFRSYLLGALKHFLAEHRRNAARLKRGGGAVIQSLESFGTDTSPGLPIPDPAGGVPDTWFDREWALAVMDRGLAAVRQSFEAAGKERQFEVLKPWLAGDTDHLSQRDAAADLGMTAGAVKVAIHRLRQGFGEAVRLEISQTVNSPAEVGEELRYLIEVLS